MKKLNQAGFTMVETLVAMALLMAAIYGSMTLMSTQKSSTKVRSAQSMYRFLAIQTSSIVTGNSERFPPITFSTDWNSDYDMAMYLGCFNLKGEMIPNDLGTREFVFHQMLKTELDKRTATNRCPNPVGGGIAGYEVRFWNSNLLTREVTIEIVDLLAIRATDVTGERRKALGVKYTPKHRFKIFR